MFQNPDHPDMQTLAEHHDAGTHEQIPSTTVADAMQAFQQHADPSLVQQVTNQHYERMSPDQLRATAQQFKDKLLSIAGHSPAAAQMASTLDPSSATPAQVAEAHKFVLKEHPELMRTLIIGGGAIAASAFVAFAARRYLESHGR